MTEALQSGTIAIGVALATAVAVRLARMLARRQSLLDHPNERSLHDVPVPRLGGAVFIPIILAGLLILAVVGRPPAWPALALWCGAGILCIVGVVDDFRPLPVAPRLLAQVGVAALFLMGVLQAGPIAVAGWAIGSPFEFCFWFLAVGIAGVINLYNFMDGIDGLAGSQAVVAGLGWVVLAGNAGATYAASLSGIVAAGAIGFLSLNWPPAKMFMGDAGSTALGFLFAAIPLLVRSELGERAEAGRLFVMGGLMLWPFLADGTFTLLRRAWRRENVLQAHRTHLYQRLVTAGKSHRQVTMLYTGLALEGALLALWAARRPSALDVGLAAGVLIVSFVLLWQWVVRLEAAHTARTI